MFAACAPAILRTQRSQGFVKNQKGTFIPPCSDRNFWDHPSIKSQVPKIRTNGGILMLKQEDLKQVGRKIMSGGQPVKVCKGQ
jgi:hypothetical protein